MTPEWLGATKRANGCPQAELIVRRDGELGGSPSTAAQHPNDQLA